MRGRLEERFEGYEGGMRARNEIAVAQAPGPRIKPNELLLAQNVTIDRETHLLRRRNGHALELDFTATLPGGTYMQDAAQLRSPGTPSPFALIMSTVGFGGGGVIYGYNLGGGALVSLLTGLSTTWPMSFASAPKSGTQGPLYMMNGSGGEAKYVTSTLPSAGNWTASAGTLPVGTIILYHGTRMWSFNIPAMAGVTQPESAMAWSDLGNPRSWPAANVAVLDPNDGEEITSAARVGPYLLVFKPHKTILVYDLDTGANRVLSGQLGCPSPKSVCETPNGTYFLTNDGRLALTDGSSIKLVDDKLNLFTQERRDMRFNQLIWWKDRLYISLLTNLGGQPAASAYDRMTIEYNPETDSWWPHTEMGRGMVVWNDGNKESLMCLPITTSPKMLVRMFWLDGSDQFDYGLSSQGYIVPIVQPPYVDFGTDRQKRLRSISVQSRAKMNTISAIADGTFTAYPGGATYPIDTTTAPELARTLLPRRKTMATGRRLGVRLSVTNIGTGTFPFEVGPITIHADTRVN